MVFRRVVISFDALWWLVGRVDVSPNILAVLFARECESEENGQQIYDHVGVTAQF